MEASSRRRPAAPGSRVAETLRAFALLAISLLTCELLLAGVARLLPALDYQLSPPWTRALTPDPVLGHRLSPYYPGHDDRGYRNESDRARYEMVAVGDSVTYGYAAAPEDSWPRQLEALSGLPTYNAGVGDYSPCEYALVAEELLVLEPRVILVGLFLGNDLSDAYAAVYVDRRLGDWRSRDPAVLALLAREDEGGTLRQRGVALGMDVPPTASGAGGLRRWLAKRSSLYGLARSVLYRSGFNRQAPLRGLADDSFATAAARPHRVAYDARSAQRTVFVNPPLQALAVDLGDARIREGLRITGDVLAGLRVRLERRGVRLLVVLLHSKSAVYAELLRAEATAGGSELLPLLADEESAAEAVRELLSRDGIRYVDTLPAMRAALALGEALFPESDDEHPSAAGYGVIAETVHGALEQAL